MSLPASRRAVLAATLAAVVCAGVATISAVSPFQAPAAAGSLALTAPVEDSGAGCPVTLPGSFPANNLLPDPFTRLDGTRITAKSDWTCRRDGPGA